MHNPRVYEIERLGSETPWFIDVADLELDMQ